MQNGRGTTVPVTVTEFPHFRTAIGMLGVSISLPAEDRQHSWIRLKAAILVAPGRRSKGVRVQSAGGILQGR